MDASDYFEIGRMYQRLCEEVIISLCKNCPHKVDDHMMNCAECCPLTHAKEKIMNKTLGDSNKNNDYAYKTIEEFEEIIHYKVSEAFRIGWNMARSTNEQLLNMTKRKAANKCY